MRALFFLFVVLTISAAVFWTSRGQADSKAPARVAAAAAPSEPAQTPIQAEACAAVQAAIRARYDGTNAPFEKCDAVADADGNTVEVGTAIQLAHTNEHGITSLDTMYYGTARRDPATGKLQVAKDDLIHD